MAGLNIKKRVFGSSVEPKVREGLNKLQSVVKPAEPGESVSNDKKYIGDNTSFARMWSASAIYTTNQRGPDGETVKKNSKGKYYYVEKKSGKAVVLPEYKTSFEKHVLHIINDNRAMQYMENPEETRYSAALQQIHELGGNKNPHLLPSAGITNVTRRTTGALGVLQSTTIEFVVHNKYDFENIIIPHFLRPGATVCVDMGWSGNDLDGLYDPIQFFQSTSDLNKEDIDKFIYGVGHEGDENYIGGFLRSESWFGKSITCIGVVINYNVTVNKLGSFNCTLELSSRNTAILDKPITTDNNLKYVFTNAMNSILVNAVYFKNRIDSMEPTGDNEEPEKVYSFMKNVVDPESTLDNKETQKITNTFFKQLLDRGNNFGLGMIDPPALLTGIYFEDGGQYANYNNPHDVNPFDDKSGLNYEHMSEMIYISFGLFEDLFLNEFVVSVKPNDEGKNNNGKDKINTSEHSTKDYKVKYNSEGMYIRYVPEFVTAQQENIEDGDKPLVFLLPESWAGSRNSILKGKTEDDCSKEKSGEEESYPGIPVMPIRELFLSVPLIKTVFKTCASIDEALQRLFTSINSASDDIYNIKLSTENESRVNLSFFDANLVPTTTSDGVYKFDVTSGNSVVIDNDLKFEIPKDGMASMIALASQTEPAAFDQSELNSFVNYALMNPRGPGEEKIYYKSIPSMGDPNQMVMTKKFEDFDKIFPRYNTSKPDVETIIDTEIANAAFSNYVEQIEGSIEKKDTPPTDGQSNIPAASKLKIEENNDAVNIIEVGTRREAHQQRAVARLKRQITPETIPYYTSIQLNLTMHGNSYLNVGDLITVNSLPSFWEKKVFFMIAEIQDSITPSGWQTTLNCLMRTNTSEHTKIMQGTADEKELPPPEQKYVLTEEKTEEMFDGVVKDQKKEAKKKGEYIPAGIWEGVTGRAEVGETIKVDQFEFTQLIAPIEPYLDYDPYYTRYLKNHLGVGLINDSVESLAYLYALTEIFRDPTYVKGQVAVDEDTPRQADSEEYFPEVPFFVQHPPDDLLDMALFHPAINYDEDKTIMQISNKKMVDDIFKKFEVLSDKDSYPYKFKQDATGAMQIDQDKPADTKRKRLTKRIETKFQPVPDKIKQGGDDRTPWPEKLIETHHSKTQPGDFPEFVSPFATSIDFVVEKKDKLIRIDRTFDPKINLLIPMIIPESALSGGMTIKQLLTDLVKTYNRIYLELTTEIEIEDEVVVEVKSSKPFYWKTVRVDITGDDQEEWRYGILKKALDRIDQKSPEFAKHLVNDVKSIENTKIVPRYKGLDLNSTVEIHKLGPMWKSKMFLASYSKEVTDSWAKPPASYSDDHWIWMTVAVIYHEWYHINSITRKNQLAWTTGDDDPDWKAGRGIFGKYKGGSKWSALGNAFDWETRCMQEEVKYLKSIGCPPKIYEDTEKHITTNLENARLFKEDGVARKLNHADFNADGVVNAQDSLDQVRDQHVANASDLGL